MGILSELPIQTKSDLSEIRQRLDSRSIDIVKRPDGTWKASIFPTYPEEPFDIIGIADDPVAAVQRLVNEMKSLP